MSTPTPESTTASTYKLLNELVELAKTDLNAALRQLIIAITDAEETGVERERVENAETQRMIEERRDRHLEMIMAKVASAELRGRIAEAEACCKLVCDDCRDGTYPATRNRAMWIHRKGEWQGQLMEIGCGASEIRERIAALRKEGR